MEPTNPFERGTAEYATQEIVNNQWRRQSAQPQQPINVPKGLGEWVAGMGCLFFVFGVLWSISAVTPIGHVILIVGTTLLGMAIAVAGYAVIKGPAFLIRLIGWAWRNGALTRSILAGTVVGVALGAWLGMSAHEVVRGVIRLGLVGAGLGLIVGVVLLMLARAAKRRAA